MIDLKEFRKANNLKQEEIADYLGVSKAFLSQIENFRRSLPDIQLSRLLNNPYNWDTRMLLIEDQNNSANKGAVQVQQNGLHNHIDHITQRDGEDVAALRKENEMLGQRIVDLKAENEKLWKMIDKLTEK